MQHILREKADYYSTQTTKENQVTHNSNGHSAGKKKMRGTMLPLSNFLTEPKMTIFFNLVEN